MNQKVNGGEEKARTDRKVLSESEDKATYLVREWMFHVIGARMDVQRTIVRLSISTSSQKQVPGKIKNCAGPVTVS